MSPADVGAGARQRLDQLVDSVGGLPTHPLLVHTVVVGVPVLALVTLLVAAAAARRPGAARRRAWLVAAADTALVGLSLLVVEAGERLQARLGGPQVAAEHAGLGERMPWFAGALAVSAVVVAAAGPRAGLAKLGVVLVAVAGVAAVWWVVRVGHSGATSVWGGVVGA